MHNDSDFLKLFNTFNSYKVLLKLENINFSFNPSKIILDNLSMTIEQGKIYALMGANGAGKSTLFNLITRFVKPLSGKIYLNGIEIRKEKPYQINLKGISRTFQDMRLIPNLTVRENILLTYKNNMTDKWYNSFLPSKKINLQQAHFQNRTNKILAQFHLSEVQQQFAGEISYGQQKLLSLACCVANDSEILLLDEPVAGVNPVFREQLVIIIKDLKKEGKTILLIEHNIDFINEVADKIFFLANGTIDCYSNIVEMKKDNTVINSYM